MASYLPLPGDDDTDIHTENPDQKGCWQVTKNAAIAGYTLGGVFGACLGIGRTIRFRQQGLPTSFVHHIGMPSVKAALSFGLFLAGFNGTACTVRQTRGKNDMWNPAIAGCGIGLAFALPGYFGNGPFRGQPRVVIVNCFATGVLGASMHMLSHSLLPPRPAEHEPIIDPNSIKNRKNQNHTAPAPFSAAWDQQDQVHVQDQNESWFIDDEKFEDPWQSNKENTRSN